MSDYVYSGLMLAKVMTAFFILFIFVPSKVIRFEEESKDWIDIIFISIIHSVFIVVIVVHFLAFLKLYETFSLFFCIAAICSAVIWLRGTHSSKFGETIRLNWVVKLLDMSESRIGLFKELSLKAGKYVILLGKSIRAAAPRFFSDPFRGIALFPVLLAAAIIRFKHSVIHLYFGASDCTLHLAWVKYLGENNIYGAGIDGAGIYPYGFHSVISAIEKLFFVDPYLIMRFLGPLVGFLIVLSIFYVVRKNFNDSYILWIALFVYVFSIGKNGLPSDVWRQMFPLPQEFAAVFLLPGVHFFNMYFRFAKRIYLLLAAECLALTILIHPYITFFLALGYFFTVLIYIKQILRLKIFLETLKYMLSGVLVGVLPMGIASLTGIPWQGSFLYGKSFLKLPQNMPSKPTALILCLTGVLVLLVIAVILYLLDERMKGSRFWFPITVLALASYLLYIAPSYGIPVPMDASRIGEFFSIPFVIVLGLLVSPVDLIITHKRISSVFKAVCCAVAFVLVFNITQVTSIRSFWANVPVGMQYDYDEALLSYLNIKRNFEASTWNIISPVEQYSLTYGYGWHTELWRFVKIAADKKIDAEDEQEFKGVNNGKLTISSEHVFIFVEKIPLYTRDPVSIKEAEKPFPPKPSLLSSYYTEPDLRNIIEAKAYFWAEDFMKRHKEVKVFFETEKFKVYYIHQPGKNYVNFLN